jgi:hypothetical protein
LQQLLAFVHCTENVTELCGERLADESKTPGREAGRFLLWMSVCGYFETRRALSELPIAVNAAAMPLAVLVG